MMQHARQAFEVSPLAVDPACHGFRLDVVRQLLGDLDTVTAAGRSFTMGKVVGLLRDEVVAIKPALSESQERVIQTALDELIREKGRLLPDPDWFVTRSQMITDTLALM